MRAKLDPEVLAQADAMVVEVETRYPGSRARLGANSIKELESWNEVALRFVSEDSGYEDEVHKCSISGRYLEDCDPPELVIAQSGSTRRDHFTALHELGHHLQRTTINLGDTAVSHSLSEEFEDASCDVFASRILIPEDIVNAAIGARGPDAESVVRLYENSNASRWACCVRAAERLVGFGGVILLDSSGVVNFSATSGIHPPAFGSSQASTPIISDLLRQPSRVVPVELDTHIAYRTGTRSVTLYGHAIWWDGYIVAVLVEDHPAWRRFAPPRSGSGRYVAAWEGCEICLEDFQVEDRCSVCGKPFCPSRHCGCTLARERTCQSCGFVWGIARFSTGSSICSDCS